MRRLLVDEMMNVILRGTPEQVRELNSVLNGSRGDEFLTTIFAHDAKVLEATRKRLPRKKIKRGIGSY